MFQAFPCGGNYSGDNYSGDNYSEDIFFQTLADIFQWPLICADEPVTQGNLWHRGVQYGPVMFTHLCLYLEIVSTNMSLFQSQEFVTQWQPNAEMLFTSLVRPQSVCC